MSEKWMRIDKVTWYGLIAAAIFPKSIGLTSAIMARHAGRTEWVAALAAVGAAMLLMAFVAWAMTPLRSAVSAELERLGGKWLGRPAALVEVLLNGLILLGGAYTFVAHIEYYFLPETPLAVILGVLGVVSVVGCYYGFEVLARTALVGALGDLFLTLITAPGIAMTVKPLQLLPLGEFGWRGFTFAVGTGLADWVGPVALATTFLPAVAGFRSPSGRVGHSVLAVLAAGLLVVMWPVWEILVLGPEMVARQAVACMTLARAAEIGIYIHRYELLMMLFFLPGVFLVAALPLLMTTQAVARLLGLRGPRSAYMPVAAVLGVAAYFVLSNRLGANRFFTEVWPTAVLVLAALLLVATGTATLLARRRT